MTKPKRNSVSDVHNGRSGNGKTAHPRDTQQVRGESECRQTNTRNDSQSPSSSRDKSDTAGVEETSNENFNVSESEQNVVGENTTYEKLEELFNGTELEVLYSVTHLIHQRTDLNSISSKITGDGILHMAVKKKFVKVAERLLDNGVLLESRNKNNLTPLHLALGQTDDEACKPVWGKNDAKCDEMAALIISKLQPFYVRYLFGDDTHFSVSSASEEIIRNESANTSARYLFGDDTHFSVRFCHKGHKAPSSQDSSQKLRFKTFNFLTVINDWEMKKTVVTILDKLEDTWNYRPVVYYKLLTKGITSESETDGKGKKKEEVFQRIVRYRQNLIEHPVVRAVILWKWTQKFHRLYLIDFIKFFVSFVAITICAVVGAQSDHVQLYDTPWQYVRAALEILTCILIFESLWSELLQCYIDPKGYVQSILNYIEVGSSVCLIISIGLRYRDVNAHWYMFAVGYVLWTVKGLKYCAVYREADAYKETLRALIKRVLFLFTVFFVALEMLFGGTLLLVLRGTNALNVEPDTESILSIYYIGLRTLIDGQTPGSLNVDNLPRVGEFVIIVFNSLTIVIMLNILIAQLSNTYNRAYQAGQILTWVNRAEAIVNYEKEDGCQPFGKIRLFGCQCKRSPKTDGTLLFDKEDFLEEKEMEDEMKAIMKQVDKTLLHTDLSVETIKSKQTALLEDKKETPAITTNINQGQIGGTRDADKLEKQLNELKNDTKKQQEAAKRQQDEMKKQLEAMKLQQDAILEAVGDIRNLLQKQE